MTDNVFHASWRRLRAGYELRLSDYPEIRVSRDTFEEAELDLFDEVAEKLQVYTPLFEYSPPAPAHSFDKKFGRLGVVNVCGANTGLDWANEGAELFTGGRCSLCKRGMGRRSQQPLRIDFSYVKSDGGFVGGKVGPRGSDMLHVFSQKFVEALQALGSDGLEWREVDTMGTSKIRHFEPTSECYASLVQPAGVDVPGWKCPRCLRFGFYLPRTEGSRIHLFLSEETIPKTAGSAFLAGSPSEYYLCMAASRWKSMLQITKWKGISSLPVGTVPNRRAVIPPVLDSIADR